MEIYEEKCNLKSLRKGLFTDSLFPFLYLF